MAQAANASAQQSQSQPTPQKQKKQKAKKAANIQQQPQKKAQQFQQLPPQNVAPAPIQFRYDVLVSSTDTIGTIDDYSKQQGICEEITISKDGAFGDLLLGIYCHTAQGLRFLPFNTRSSNGKLIQGNQLAKLQYTEKIKRKMHNTSDIRHSFSVAVEANFGPWARVIIDNSIHRDLNQLLDPNQKFHLYITIPGHIDEINYLTGEVIERHYGVFEFTVRKTLYDPNGLCVHRFFAPKGTVGATGFGAKARAKAQQQGYYA